MESIAVHDHLTLGGAIFQAETPLKPPHSTRLNPISETPEPAGLSPGFSPAPNMTQALLPPPIRPRVPVNRPAVGQSTVWVTACSQRAIMSCARARAMVGIKRRSARHNPLSSAVFL
jgi:hypothetical protein